MAKSLQNLAPSGQILQPEGMEKEAGVLAILSQVPSISKAWISAASVHGATMAVSS
jgi:hypothetical protein